jgi:dUTP pyrophosphatase
MNIKKLSEKAIIPTKGSKDAAGYDLYAIESHTLKPLERKLFKTGLAMAIPSGMYGKIVPRSGLALKCGIDVLAGTIDEDYRNEVGVVLINLSNEDVTLPIIKDGKETAIAQIIFRHYYNVNITVVDDLNVTERNMGGFGSSDVKSSNNIIPITANGTHLYDASSKGEIALPTNKEEIRERMPSIMEKFKKHELNTPIPYEQRIKEQIKDK